MAIMLAYGMKDRDKRMLKLTFAKLLNPKFFRNDSNVFKFMQVHENK